MRTPCISGPCPPSRVLGHSSEHRGHLGSPRFSPSVRNPGRRRRPPALPGAATGGRRSGPTLTARARARETGELARTPRSVAVYPTDACSSPPSRGRGEVASPPEEKQKTEQQWREESVPGSLAVTASLPDLFGDRPEEGGSQSLSLESAKEARGAPRMLQCHASLRLSRRRQSHKRPQGRSPWAGISRTGAEVGG